MPIQKIASQTAIQPQRHPERQQDNYTIKDIGNLTDNQPDNLRDRETTKWAMRDIARQPHMGYHRDNQRNKQAPRKTTWQSNRQPENQRDHCKDSQTTERTARK